MARFRGLAKGLSQSVLSLSFNLGGLAAGAVIASYTDVLASTPWSLLIYPGILSIRGAIGGLFSGRLSTALHLGTIRPSIFNNTKEAHSLFHSIITLTFISSVVMGSTAVLFSNLMLASAHDAVSLLVVVTATMGVSILLISPITFGVSVFSSRRGLDPDVILYPITSTIADIIVSIIYLLMLNSLSSSSQSLTVLGLIDLPFLSTVCYLTVKNIRNKSFTKTIKEFILTLLFVSFVVNITGTILTEIGHSIGKKPEIYFVYPALIDTLGDVGSVIGCTATTKMAMGYLTPSFSSIRQLPREIGSAWLASLIMFGMYSVVSSSLYGFKGFNSLFLQLMIINFLSIPLIIVISLTVAIVTRRRGLDPDNFLIPVETSLADGLTTLSLLAVIRIITI